MRTAHADGTDMILCSTRQFGWLLAALLYAAAQPSLAQDVPAKDEPAARAAAVRHRGAIEAYLHARRAYEDEASAYWQSVADKRRGRNAKRRNNETIALDDYVLTQPPVYTGPPRPPGYIPPRHDPVQPALPIPGIADFLKAAAEHYGFVPDRPKTDTEFKQAYAKIAAAAPEEPVEDATGLTKTETPRVLSKQELSVMSAEELQSGLAAGRYKLS